MHLNPATALVGVMNSGLAKIGRRQCFLILAALSGAFLVQGSVHAQALDLRLEGPPTAEFHFARLMYAGSNLSRRRDSWTTDYPDAEYHLMQGVNRMTRIDGEPVNYSGSGGRLINLADDRVFEYPWLYAVEVGQWYLSESEAGQLREYLDRGGFLMVDDFWDEYEWDVFAQSMSKVFPDRPIVDLEEDHPLMNVSFDLNQDTQIPGRNGQQFGTSPQWRAIFDDHGRLVVAINFNMDMGDAWEHADDPFYPEPMTSLAYRFGVNYIIYSMTH